MKPGDRVRGRTCSGTTIRTDRHGIEWIIHWDDGTTSVELTGDLEPGSIDD
jgi:hypothetical protein